jgi:putative Ca2+/H+ antiporter (TMEM165/GDT1 family)
MDWKVLLTSFGMLFLAELGDKTQLAVVTLTTETKKPMAVFLGAVLALALVTLLGVVLGSLIQQWIPLNILRKGASVVFVTLGVAIFFGWL